MSERQLGQKPTQGEADKLKDPVGRQAYGREGSSGTCDEEGSKRHQQSQPPFSVEGDGDTCSQSGQPLQEKAQFLPHTLLNLLHIPAESVSHHHNHLPLSPPLSPSLSLSLSLSLPSDSLSDSGDHLTGRGGIKPAQLLLQEAGEQTRLQPSYLPHP